ncbi:MAG TPA: hypothetical protein VJB70_02905 [Candidatus Paceibacterota bacterium]
MKKENGNGGFSFEILGIIGCAVVFYRVGVGYIDWVTVIVLFTALCSLLYSSILFVRSIRQTRKEISSLNAMLEAFNSGTVVPLEGERNEKRHA